MVVLTARAAAPDWLPPKDSGPRALCRRTALTCEGSGALGGTRTPNLLIRSQMLYPLSYERRRTPHSVRHLQGDVSAVPAVLLRLVGEIPA